MSDEDAMNDNPANNDNKTNAGIIQNNDIDQTTSRDDTNLGVLCHICALIPLVNIIVSLVIWILKREESKFVEHHGKESLNFQITMTIGYLISFILMFLFVIAKIIFIGLIIFNSIVVIIASIKTGEGRYYRYPYSLKLIK